LLWLKEGDAPTKFFHIQADGRKHRDHIHSLQHGGLQLVSEDAKASVMFDFFKNVLGTPPEHTNVMNLDVLDPPRVQQGNLVDRFTEEEVWHTIRLLPSDKASSPNGFTTRIF
jgi:hypothetical protein